LITIFGNETGFDVEDTSIDGRDDIEGLDASAAHIANLLSSEPSDVKLGIGGFSMGATVALHSVACYAHGKFTSGIPYPITLNAVISLSGWLPCSRTLRSKMESSHIATRRAASLPILLCHGRVDEVVTYRNGERSAEILRSSGFSNLIFKPYNGLGHYTIPEEMDDLWKWLSSTLGLNRSR
jgi:lysophospholipase-2